MIQVRTQMAFPDSSLMFFVCLIVLFNIVYSQYVEKNGKKRYFEIG